MSTEPASSAPQGPLPAVHDEAADTPAWLPVTGLVALLVILLWMLYRASIPAPVAEEIVEAPADTAEAPAEAE
jgi:hypothetical protein